MKGKKHIKMLLFTALRYCKWCNFICNDSSILNPFSGSVGIFERSVDPSFVPCIAWSLVYKATATE